jgi:hypothetical protein
MFDHVHFVSIPVLVLPEAHTCRAVTPLYKPDCPVHIRHIIMKSPFKADFKGAHFESYDKMYATGTWIFPVLRSLLPSNALLISTHPDYAVKPMSTESLWETQLCSCANGSHMKQGFNYEESYTLVTSINITHIFLCIDDAHGKKVCFCSRCSKCISEHHKIRRIQSYLQHVPSVCL